MPASIDAGLPWLQRQRERFSNRTALRWAMVPSGAAGSVGTVGPTFAAPVQRRPNWAP